MSRSAFLVLFVLFLPFAFSEEFATAISEARGDDPLSIDQTAWLLPAIDATLLFFVVLPITVHIWIKSPWRRTHWLWWIVGAGATLVLDAFRTGYLGDRHGEVDEIPLAWDVPLSVLYIFAFALLVGGTFGVSPKGFLDREDPARPDFLATVPLLVGLLVGYLAGDLWNQSISGLAERDEGWTEVQECGTNILVDGRPNPCQAAVDPEYFAQLSQIIPLILIGVGLEAGFFKQTVKSPVQRAALTLTIVVLLLGEVLAILTLPYPKEGDPDQLVSEWWEFFAFVFVVQAAAVGLATLAWALITGLSRSVSATTDSSTSGTNPDPGGM